MAIRPFPFPIKGVGSARIRAELIEWTDSVTSLLNLGTYRVCGMGRRHKNKVLRIRKDIGSILHGVERLYALKRINGDRYILFKCRPYRYRIRNYNYFLIFIPLLVVEELSLRVEDYVSLYVVTEKPKNLVREVRVWCGEWLIARARVSNNKIVVESVEGSLREELEQLKERVVLQLLSLGVPRCSNADLRTRMAFIACLVSLVEDVRGLMGTRKLTGVGASKLGSLAKHLSSKLGVENIEVKFRAWRWRAWLEEEVPIDVVDVVVSGRAYYYYMLKKWTWLIQMKKRDFERIIGYTPRRAIVGLHHDEHFEILGERSLILYSQKRKVCIPIPKMVAEHIKLKHRSSVKVAIMSKDAFQKLKRVTHFFSHSAKLEFFVKEEGDNIVPHLNVEGKAIRIPISKRVLVGELLSKAYYDGLTKFPNFASMMVATHATIIDLERAIGKPLGWRPLSGNRAVTLESILFRVLEMKRKLTQDNKILC